LSPEEILNHYWRFPFFKNGQAEIVDEIIKGRNVLGLLPTGGGKSICYQVPGLYFDGVTIVVSPLIALMKDQVEQLVKVGITAHSLHAGLDQSEIKTILEACLGNSKIRFLFVSPERLASKLFQDNLELIDVNMLVVDEAHCISQWGYDFRPSYLNIVSIIEKLKNKSIPIVALTASATPDVQDDIVDKLKLGEDVFVFKGVFNRENLSLNVRKVEDKYIKLLNVLKAVEGTSIVYVTSRRTAEKVARFLDNNNVSSLYYHAGLKSEEREQRQNLWLNNQVRVIVATNAFGMGIDKSNVRTVIHFQLPNSLEAYYQEAGRAGRDGKKSYAVLLYTEEDKVQLRKHFEESYPTFDLVLQVYNALGNFFKLALGAKPVSSYDIDINQISLSSRISLNLFFYALKRLENTGVVALNDAFNAPSRVHFLINHEELYRYQVANPRNEKLLKTIVRTYGTDVFSEYLKIDEQLLANEIRTGKQEVSNQLRHLTEKKILNYQRTNENPQITFLMPRCSTDKLKELFVEVEELKEKRFSALGLLIDYLTTTTCRSMILAQYFGFSASSCGVCDICVSNESHYSLREQLLNHLKILGTVSLNNLHNKLHEFPEELIKNELRLMVDLGIVQMDEKGSFWV